ncbi:MAG: hypothetical protein BAJATHORv1_30113 [Candidatus Thorarchaeota archaeon]|nr:MAG: hypothetical protein BAJATHORv1_30113 [Candidatus Thorarchaeota archaeon]
MRHAEIIQLAMAITRSKIARTPLVHQNTNARISEVIITIIGNSLFPLYPSPLSIIYNSRFIFFNIHVDILSYKLNW